MTDLLTAVALALVLEGVAYALAPTAMQRLAAQIQAMPANALRISGLAGVVIGVVIVWLLRG